MPSHAFARTTTGEPHLERRLAILAQHPEIRELEGHDTRTAWVTLLVVFAHLGMAWLLGRAAASGQWMGSWWMIVVWSYVVGAVLCHWLSMTIHETSHDLAFASPAANQALAFFACLPMVIPAAATFRRYHLDHHTYLGVDTADSDLPHPKEVAWLGNAAWKKCLWLTFYLFVYLVRGTTFAKRPSKLEILNTVVQLIFVAAFVAFAGWWALLYLCLSLFFGHSLHPVACHFIHEHYVFEPGQETYSYYGPLNLVTFNVGYHVEHHDFMNVPGWRLPELRARIPQYYASLRSHRSWTWVLWHFISARHMSAARRIVRSAESYQAARTRALSRAAEGLAPEGPVRMNTVVEAP